MPTDLFDWTPPLMTEPRAHKGVETSEEAARSMRKCSGPMQMRIARYLGGRGHKGATYDEIVETLQLEKPTVAGRLNDLSGEGFIYWHGTRHTRSGRPARVYRLSDKGRELIAGSET